MSHDEFPDYWTSAHVFLAREIPGVIWYARVISIGPERAEFDGIAEFCSESLNALRTGLGHESPHDHDPDHPRANTPHEDVNNLLSIGDHPRFVDCETVQEDVSGG